MAVKFTAVRCPACGANLSIEEGRTQMFCSYCGSNIIMTNENEHIYRHIDEAQIKRAEADRLIQLKKIEFAERKRESAEKVKKIKIVISILLGILGIGLLLAGAGMGSLVGLIVLEMIMFIWIFGDKEKDDDIDFGDKIRVPSSVSSYESKNYTAIESLLINAGFTNIRCVPLNDLTIGIMKKPGMVESITINGHEITSGGKKFSPNALVVISYHSFPER